VTPRRLASPSLSLPPMLHMISQDPILCYSKGSRGLSVLPRDRGIFTSNSVSPSLLLRQCPCCYAIHAGRNLPDKEFRYLRTVIVTAAVNWGFGYELLPEGITPPLNLPAPSRRQSVYCELSSLHRPVFLVNSHMGLFSAAPSRFVLREH
jgi:hypothetical protein